MQNKIGYEHNKFLTLHSSFPSSYYSYFTIFLYDKIDKELTADRIHSALSDAHREYCFRRYFTDIRDRISKAKGVGDYVVIRLDIKPKAERNHFIMMSPEQILRFANNFEGMLGYHAEFIDIDKGGQDTLYLKVNFPVLSADGLVEKFVLSWIRYVWEMPYSFCAFEALRLFDLGVFKGMDLFNLTDFTMGMVSDVKGASNFNSGHYITRGAGYMPLDKVEKYLKEGKAGNWDGVNGVSKVKVKAFTNYTAFRIHSLEEALTENKFQERIKEHYTKYYDKWLGK